LNEEGFDELFDAEFFSIRFFFDFFRVFEDFLGFFKVFQDFLGFLRISWNFWGFSFKLFK
jgi:hypothetical protein